MRTPRTTVNQVLMAAFALLCCVAGVGHYRLCVLIPPDIESTYKRFQLSADGNVIVREYADGKFSAKESSYRRSKSRLSVGPAITRMIRLGDGGIEWNYGWQNVEHLFRLDDQQVANVSYGHSPTNDSETEYWLGVYDLGSRRLQHEETQTHPSLSGIDPLTGSLLYQYRPGTIGTIDLGQRPIRFTQREYEHHHPLNGSSPYGTSAMRPVSLDHDLFVHFVCSNPSYPFDARYAELFEIKDHELTFVTDWQIDSGDRYNLGPVFTKDSEIASFTADRSAVEFRDRRGMVVRTVALPTELNSYSHAYLSAPLMAIVFSNAPSGPFVCYDLRSMHRLATPTAGGGLQRLIYRDLDRGELLYLNEYNGKEFTAIRERDAVRLGNIELDYPLQNTGLISNEGKLIFASPGDRMRLFLIDPRNCNTRELNPFVNLQSVLIVTIVASALALIVGVVLSLRFAWSPFVDQGLLLSSVGLPILFRCWMAHGISYDSWEMRFISIEVYAALAVSVGWWMLSPQRLTRRIVPLGVTLLGAMWFLSCFPMMAPEFIAGTFAKYVILAGTSAILLGLVRYFGDRVAGPIVRGSSLRIHHLLILTFAAAILAASMQGASTNNLASAIHEELNLGIFHFSIPICATYLIVWKYRPVWLGLVMAMIAHGAVSNVRFLSYGFDDFRQTKGVHFIDTLIRYNDNRSEMDSLQQSFVVAIVVILLQIPYHLRGWELRRPSVVVPQIESQPLVSNHS